MKDNNEDASIKIKIDKLVRTVYELMQPSRDGWVTWRQVAKHQEGSDSEEIITHLCAIAELPQAMFVFGKNGKLLQTK